MIRITIAGDLCPRYRCFGVVHSSEYSDSINDVQKIIKESNYALVNLECPIIEGGKPIKKQGPNLKAPLKVIDFIKYCGFDGVTLANNHFYDYGEDGVISTINICKRYNIDFVGGGENIENARNILYKTINDKNLEKVSPAKVTCSLSQTISITFAAHSFSV